MATLDHYAALQLPPYYRPDGGTFYAPPPPPQVVPADTVITFSTKHIIVVFGVVLLSCFCMCVVMLVQQSQFFGWFDTPAIGDKHAGKTSAAPSEPSDLTKLNDAKKDKGHVSIDPYTGMRYVQGKLSTDNLREGRHRLYWTDERFKAALEAADLYAPPGRPGKAGSRGAPGKNAMEIVTYEAVNLNLTSYAYEIKYDAEEKPLSVVYAMPDGGVITKSYTYDEDRVLTSTLSGDVPGGAPLTKHYEYEDKTIVNVFYT